MDNDVWTKFVQLAGFIAIVVVFASVLIGGAITAMVLWKG